MLRRLHVSFRGLEHGPRRLVDRVEDVVAGGLCEVHHGSSDRLVRPLLLLVQQLLRLVQGKLRPYYGGVRARDLRKSLHNESTVMVPFGLILTPTWC